MRNHSILVIDDEPDNFEVIETLLAIENYEVYYASNGEEALASLDTFNPDVILLDLMMPGMSGLEVCQQMRLRRKWRSTPIIMVTVTTGKSILAECLDSGADDFINKPVDGIELRARVKSMLRNKKQFDRIESLSRLQQNNITELENNLDELVGDLALGFVNELSVPLTSIQEQLKELDENLNELNESQTRYLVKLARKSAGNIQKTTYKFWSYLDLTDRKNKIDDNENHCDIKATIEQIAILQVHCLNRDNALTLDLDLACVAVNTKHCELIVKELLDNAFKFAEPAVTIELRGRVVDRYFELSISDGRSDYPLDRYDDRVESESPALELGLKVVKKIVDMHNGSLSITTSDRHETIVCARLPLLLAGNLVEI